MTSSFWSRIKHENINKMFIRWESSNITQMHIGN